MSTSDTDDLLAERHGNRRGDRPGRMVPVVAAGGVWRVRALGADHATAGEFQVDVRPGPTYVGAMSMTSTMWTTSRRAVRTEVCGCRYAGA